MSRADTPTTGLACRIGGIALIVLAAAGCNSSVDSTKFSSYELPGMRNAPAPTSPAPAPVNMGGRWTLVSPGRGQCGMNFGFTPNAAEGTIAPEGGCPGKFFTSRKWTFETTGLTVRDHNAEPLALLAYASGHFEGQSTGGEPVTLTRGIGAAEPMAPIR